MKSTNEWKNIQIIKKSSNKTNNDSKGTIRLPNSQKMILKRKSESGPDEQKYKEVLKEKSSFCYVVQCFLIYKKAFLPTKDKPFSQKKPVYYIKQGPFHVK